MRFREGYRRHDENEGGTTVETTILVVVLTAITGGALVSLLPVPKTPEE